MASVVSYDSGSVVCYRLWSATSYDGCAVVDGLFGEASMFDNSVWAPGTIVYPVIGWNGLTP